MDPQIRFCTSADGTRIAYATVGEGPPLVVVPGWGHNVELDWRQRGGHEFFERLSQGRLVASLDRRGVGASQREVDDMSLEAQAADLTAVTDHLRLERFDLLGSLDGAALGAVFAVQHPERVSRLVFWNPYMWGRGHDSPAWRSLLELIRTNWRVARRTMADAVFPSGPTELQVWWSDLLRESVSPDTATAPISPNPVCPEAGRGPSPGNPQAQYACQRGRWYPAGAFSATCSFH